MKSKVVPSIDDEFAKKFGQNTLVELKDTVRKGIEQQEKARIDEDFKKRLLRQLTETNQIELPKSLQQEQKDKLIEDFKHRMMSQGMSEVEYEKYKSDWDQDFEKTAKFLVHSYFLVDKLARDNNMRPTEKDLEAELIQYSADSGLDIAELRKYYQNPDLRGRLSYQIMEKKIVQLVQEKANVVEVAKDKLPKDEQN